MGSGGAGSHTLGVPWPRLAAMERELREAKEKAARAAEIAAAREEAAAEAAAKRRDEEKEKARQAKEDARREVVEEAAEDEESKGVTSKIKSQFANFSVLSLLARKTPDKEEKVRDRNIL